MTTPVNSSQELRDGIPTATVTLADNIKKEMVVDHNTGFATFTDNFANVALGDEFTPEQAESLTKRMVLASDATQLAVGEAAIDAFKANSEVQRVTGTTPLGGFNLDVDVQRESSVRNVSTGEVNTIKNAASSKLSIPRQSGKAGYKKVRKYLQSLGGEEL